MKAIMVMFDTLNRRHLPPYGCDWVKAPNFERLAKRTVTFDNSYVGSMPCMPARREIHTGRYNFLHRSWGPLEPFDDSMPLILHENGIHSHLCTDHQHYFEQGGCTYHQQYTTWDFHRGQEGDPWVSTVGDIETPKSVSGRTGRMWDQDWKNRAKMTNENDQPQAKTFKAGVEFLDENKDADNWFLQLETFDPHEPFFTQQHYKDLYPHDYDGDHFDWPPYCGVTETPEQVQHLRYEYAALVSMCDAQLGKVLDKMDAYNLWEDTLLIVNTDHGFLLGEHDLWAKCHMPFYDEIAHTPLFIWDPRCKKQNERRNSLVQTIDLPATLLSYFNLGLPKDMQGKDLTETIANDTSVREVCLFGIHGNQVNVTDGRYVYMRGPENVDVPPSQYTLMPTHMHSHFSAKDLASMSRHEGFSFTKDYPVMKMSCEPWIRSESTGKTLLFDLHDDPEQKNPLKDENIEKHMIEQLKALMQHNEAPPELYERLAI